MVLSLTNAVILSNNNFYEIFFFFLYIYKGDNAKAGLNAHYYALGAIISTLLSRCCIVLIITVEETNFI